MPLRATRKELLTLSGAHLTAARMAERMGPNIEYAKTLRLCAVALRLAARARTMPPDPPTKE